MGLCQDAATTFSRNFSMPHKKPEGSVLLCITCVDPEVGTEELLSGTKELRGLFGARRAMIAASGVCRGLWGRPCIWDRAWGHEALKSEREPTVGASPITMTSIMVPYSWYSNGSICLEKYLNIMLLIVLFMLVCSFMWLGQD